MTPLPTPSDVEMADVRGDGHLTSENHTFSFSYREEESGVAVQVENKENGLTVTRGGAVLAFRLGECTAFPYRTAYGTLPMEAYTEEISLQERGSTRLLTLVYIAVFGGMAQKNEMRFKITL